MRRLGPLAVVLALPGAAAAQVSVELPSWCTSALDEPAGGTLSVRVRADLDTVEIAGRPLRRSGEGFAGEIDLLPLLAAKPLHEPVGDLELGVLGYGRGMVTGARAVCRIHRTPFEVVAAVPEHFAGRPLPWATRYGGGDPGRHPRVIVSDQVTAWRRGQSRVSVDFLTWKLAEPLRALELIVLDTRTSRVLGRCRRCQLDSKSTDDEKFACRRTQEVRELRVIEARTGRELEAHVFTADPPPACRADLTFADAVSRVPDGDVEDWLRDHY